VIVTVADSDHEPVPDLAVYAYLGQDEYGDISGGTDFYGKTTLMLPEGTYRFKTEQYGIEFWSNPTANCNTPNECTNASITVIGRDYLANDQTITYTYDDLNRLTAADYDIGLYYHYTYDAVGNRLSQETAYNNTPVTTNYTYDNANRIATVGAQAYTYDTNGNLTNDGQYTYNYDTANRLTSLSANGVTTNYRYNGNGDRLQYSTSTGNFRNYNLDLNTSLPVILQDGYSTDTYGNGQRLGYELFEEYYQFENDSLGSVRQIIKNDRPGTVSWINSTTTYDPYGNVILQAGWNNDHGYTGEFQDAALDGLVYLRARYMSPRTGTFLSRDSWDGNDKKPISYDKWLYGDSNPIKYTDPTGSFTYNRSAAVNYAMLWDHNSALDPNYDITRNAEGAINLSNQCTMFASSVLSYGGIVDERDDPILNGGKEYSIPYWNYQTMMDGKWNYKGYSGLSWIRTNTFYDFVTHYVGYTVVMEPNPPQYKGDLVPDEKKDKNWQNMLLAMRSVIQKGDLVFYGKSKTSWDHVAIIVGWGFPTAWDSKDDPGSGPTGEEPSPEENKWIETMECRENKYLYHLGEGIKIRPLVVERSGGLDYKSYRSLDNTNSKIDYLEGVSRSLCK
jgi:RHS repeat-associated protein